MAKDLIKEKGKSIIYVGERQPTDVHLLALVINSALGNLNNTINIRQKVTETALSQQDSLNLLINRIRNNKVSHLLVLGGNPVFHTQSEGLGSLLKNVKESIHLTSMLNETSLATVCSIPEAHYLESWGDTRAYDGTKCFIQPLIRPLYNGMTKIEVLAQLTNYKFSKGYDIVKEGYSKRFVGKTNSSRLC